MIDRLLIGMWTAQFIIALEAITGTSWYSVVHDDNEVVLHSVEYRYKTRITSLDQYHLWLLSCVAVVIKEKTHLVMKRAKEREENV